MRPTFEYPDSFLNRLEVVGSTKISPENSDKYWKEHKANMSWGIQKALSQSSNPRDVAILGAGQCNDIRLLEVMQRGSVENVDLYDLDAKGVSFGINYVKEKIYRLMPEAINFANFNPVITDVTFVMRGVVKKFDHLIRSYQSNMALVGPKRQKEVYRSILTIINEELSKRKVPERQYDVVVSDCILSQIIVCIELQIERVIEELFSKGEKYKDIWDDLNNTAHEIFIEDHIKILQAMTREGGTIFIASDRIMLYRGKVSRAHLNMLSGMKERGEVPCNESLRDFGDDYIIEELSISRFRYKEGDLVKIVEDQFPELSILKSREWEWNRQPHELQNKGATFGAEKVQGVVVKKGK